MVETQKRQGLQNTDGDVRSMDTYFLRTHKTSNNLSDFNVKQLRYRNILIC